MLKDDIVLRQDEIEDGGDVDELEEFSYEGYQVVRREFYAHLYDAAVNFKCDSITFNTACINKLDTDYIHVLINPLEKKMAIRLCSEDAKDAVRWARYNKKQQKKVPRRILCRLFCAKLFDMLEWNPEYKYKLQGNLVQNDGDILVLFDFSETEIYTPVEKNEDGTKKKTAPYFPVDWKTSFGLPVTEHNKALDVLIQGYQRLEYEQLRKVSKKKVKKEEVISSKQQSLFDIDGGDNNAK